MFFKVFQLYTNNFYVLNMETKELWTEIMDGPRE